MERGAQAGRAARGSPANAALRGLLLSIRDRGRILLPPPPPCPDPPPPRPRSAAPDALGRRCPRGSRSSVRFSAVPLSFRSEAEPRAPGGCFHVLLPSRRLSPRIPRYSPAPAADARSASSKTAFILLRSEGCAKETKAPVLRIPLPAHPPLL